MDPDLNKYDLDHRVTHHPVMSDEEWEQTYEDVWNMYYTREHRLRIMRRNAAYGISPGKTGFLLNYFWAAYKVEDLHPLEVGLVRRRYRKDRRPGMKLENPLTFYGREWFGFPIKVGRWLWNWASLYPAYMGMKAEMKKNNKRLPYMDKALEPVVEDEDDFDRGMYQSDAAKAFVEKQKKMADIKKSVAAE
jgi:hypothetical protein